MKHLKLCAAILFICFEAFTAHADETVSVKVGYASLTATGNLAVTAAGVTGTRLSDATLGLKRSNNVTAEFGIQLGDGRLSASYLPLKFNGTSTLATGVNFNGQNFTAGTAITSELKASITDIGYTYYLINMDDLPSRLQFGIETSIKYIQLNSSINGGGTSTTSSVNIPLPTIGLRGRVALADFIGISGRVGYVGYNGNKFTDIDAQIEFSPLPTLGIYGGYRYLDVKADSSGVSLNAQFKGPFAGLFFRF